MVAVVWLVVGVWLVAVVCLVAVALLVVVVWLVVQLIVMQVGLIDLFPEAGSFWRKRK